MEPGFLYLSVLTGAFGTGYFIYGKKQSKPIPLITGIILCIYTYFIDNLMLSIFIGLILIALPFIVKGE